MPGGDVGALGVAASLILVAVAIALSVRAGLGLERSLVWASVRALAQLLVVGAALAVVIDPDRPLVLSWLWVAVMLVFYFTYSIKHSNLEPYPRGDEV